MCPQVVSVESKPVVVMGISLVCSGSPTKALRLSSPGQVSLNQKQCPGHSGPGHLRALDQKAASGNSMMPRSVCSATTRSAASSGRRFAANHFAV